MARNLVGHGGACLVGMGDGPDFVDSCLEALSFLA